MVAERVESGEEEEVRREVREERGKVIKSVFGMLLFPRARSILVSPSFELEIGHALASTPAGHKRKQLLFR